MVFKYLLFLLLMFFLFCSKNPNQIAGGGTRGGNPIIGKIVNMKGQGVEGVEVTAIKSDARPDIVLNVIAETDTTDTAGYYELWDLDTLEYYNILGEATDGNKVFIESVFVSSSSDTIPNDTITPPGTIMGTIRDENIDKVFIYIPGTPYYVTPDSNGDYVLDNIPQGILQVIILHSDTLVENKISRVNSNDTTFHTNIALTPGLAYYVAPNGDNNNTGSLTAPWASIMYAIKNTAPGDTIYLRQGKYIEWEIWIQGIKGWGGTIDNYKTIKAYPNEEPIITGDRRLIIDANYISIEGITFDYPYRVEIKRSNYGGQFVKIINNKFIGQQPKFAAIEHAGDNGLIEGNTIDFTPVGNDAGNPGIYLEYGENVTIRNNTIKGTGGHGIVIYDEKQDGDAPNFIRRFNNILIEKNSIGGSNKRSGIFVGNGPSTLIENITIRFNTIFDNNHVGINIAGGTGINIFHNTIYRNGKQGIYVGIQSAIEITGIIIKNNIIDQSPNQTCLFNCDWFGEFLIGTVNNIQKNAIGYNLYWPDSIVYSGFSDSTSVVADPLWVDPAKQDFRLKSNSPAIDKGIDLGFDYNGAAPDLGAFEF